MIWSEFNKTSIRGWIMMNKRVMDWAISLCYEGERDGLSSLIFTSGCQYTASTDWMFRFSYKILFLAMLQKTYRVSQCPIPPKKHFSDLFRLVLNLFEGNRNMLESCAAVYKNKKFIWFEAVEPLKHYSPFLGTLNMNMNDQSSIKLNISEQYQSIMIYQYRLCDVDQQFVIAVIF